jgi:amino acid transporter
MTEVAAPARKFRRLVVGRPMQTEELEETLLPKFLALPIFASDPLSSVAYATESALVVLVAAAGLSAAHLVLPISLAISGLLAIVVVSYMQTVLAYETSGGAYVVARENLGTLPSLVGAAALLTDYVLTVAVSISAGIFAITSFAPSLSGHKVGLSLACLLVIVLANLRGVRESGLAFAAPTYLFVSSIAILVVVGLFHHGQAVTPDPLPVGTGTLTLFVLLRAFSSGSTALTGVEAIANGVNAFRRPHGRNAAITLAVLGSIAISLFVGVSYLAVETHARPSASASVDADQRVHAREPARTASACPRSHHASAASGASSGIAGGSTSLSEMKLTSATRRATGSGTSDRVRRRASVPSRLFTRGSRASLGWSCPWPTSAA